MSLLVPRRQGFLRTIVGRLSLFEDEHGLGVEPIDPTKDLTTTLRFLRWLIGVGLWIAGKIADRRQIDEVVLEQVVSRARDEGRIKVL